MSQCCLFKAESLKAIAQGNALCALDYLKSSPVKAKAFALTGLQWAYLFFHRALPYAFAGALSGQISLTKQQ